MGSCTRPSLSILRKKVPAEECKIYILNALLIASKRTARPLLRSLNEAVAEDGLPEIGQRISEGEPLWCAFHDSSSERIYGRYKGSEIAYIHAVHIIGYVTTKLCVIHFGQVWQ